jgi:hypothetical protein
MRPASSSYSNHGAALAGEAYHRRKPFEKLEDDISCRWA